ncbi:MAG: hypothetical protein ABH848_05925 [Candidatus Omnitrophota bacterium]
MSIFKHIKKTISLLIVITFFTTSNVYPYQPQSKATLRTNASFGLTRNQESVERFNETAIMQHYGISKIFPSGKAIKSINNMQNVQVLLGDKTTVEIPSATAIELIESNDLIVGEDNDKKTIVAITDPLLTREKLAQSEIKINGFTLGGAAVTLSKAPVFTLKEIQVIADKYKSGVDDIDTRAIKEMVTDKVTYTPEVLKEMLESSDDVESLQALVAIYKRGGMFRMSSEQKGMMAIAGSGFLGAGILASALLMVGLDPEIAIATSTIGGVIGAASAGVGIMSQEHSEQPTEKQTNYDPKVIMKHYGISKILSSDKAIKSINDMKKNEAVNVLLGDKKTLVPIAQTEAINLVKSGGLIVGKTDNGKTIIAISDPLLTREALGETEIKVTGFTLDGTSVTLFYAQVFTVDEIAQASENYRNKGVYDSATDKVLPTELTKLIQEMVTNKEKYTPEKLKISLEGSNILESKAALVAINERGGMFSMSSAKKVITAAAFIAIAAFTGLMIDTADKLFDIEERVAKIKTRTEEVQESSDEIEIGSRPQMLNKQEALLNRLVTMLKEGYDEEELEEVEYSFLDIDSKSLRNHLSSSVYTDTSIQKGFRNETKRMQKLYGVILHTAGVNLSKEKIEEFTDSFREKLVKYTNALGSSGTNVRSEIVKELYELTKNQSVLTRLPYIKYVTLLDVIGDGAVDHIFPLLFDTFPNKDDFTKILIEDFDSWTDYLKAYAENKDYSYREEEEEFPGDIGDVLTASALLGLGARKPQKEVFSTEDALTAEDAQSYTLDGTSISKEDGEELLKTLNASEWLNPESTKSIGGVYNFTLNRENIDIVAFSADYVKNKPGEFLENAKVLLNKGKRQRPVILATSDDQEATIRAELSIYPELEEMLEKGEIFIVRVEPEQAEALLALGKDGISFDMSEISVTDMINEKEVREATIAIGQKA